MHISKTCVNLHTFCMQGTGVQKGEHSGNNNNKKTQVLVSARCCFHNVGVLLQLKRKMLNWSVLTEAVR